MDVVEADLRRPVAFDQFIVGRHEVGPDARHQPAGVLAQDAVVRVVVGDHVAAARSIEYDVEMCANRDVVFHQSDTSS
jgi:hypothetical protein